MHIVTQIKVVQAFNSIKFYFLCGDGVVGGLKLHWHFLYRRYDLIPRMPYLHWFYFWPPEVSKFWRSRPPESSEVKKKYQNRIGTAKTMIWYLIWLIFIDFIFWPPEVTKFYRSPPPGSSEVKIRMESERQKSYDLIP